MSDLPDVTLSPRQQRIHETAMLIQWMEEHPAERGVLLWLANNDFRGQRAVDLAPVTMGQIMRLPSQIAAVRKYMEACLVGVCDRCLTTVIEFGEQHIVDWPLPEHRCKGVVAPKWDEPRRMPAVRGLPS